MAWRSAAFSRTLLQTARSPSTASSTVRRLVQSPPSRSRRLRLPRRSFITNPRMLGELGCAQSMMPLHSVVADARLTSHIAVDARACCELTQGT